jgi:hypothetical protein
VCPHITFTKEVGYKINEKLQRHNLPALPKTLKKREKVKFFDDGLGLMALF